MNKKSAFFAAGVALVAIAAFVISGRMNFPAASSAQTRQPEAQEIPDHAVYRVLFRRIAANKARADEIERRGGDAGGLRSAFQRRANLDDRQAQMLERIAWQAALEMQALDERASQILGAFRAQYPNGEVPRGQIPAPPPAELRELSAARKAVVLRKRDELRAAFGEGEFARFHDFVKNKMKPNLAPPAPRQ